VALAGPHVESFFVKMEVIYFWLFQFIFKLKWKKLVFVNVYDFVLAPYQSVYFDESFNKLWDTKITLQPVQNWVFVQFEFPVLFWKKMSIFSAIMHYLSGLVEFNQLILPTQKFSKLKSIFALFVFALKIIFSGTQKKWQIWKIESEFRKAICER